MQGGDRLQQTTNFEKIFTRLHFETADRLCLALVVQSWQKVPDSLPTLQTLHSTLSERLETPAGAPSLFFKESYCSTVPVHSFWNLQGFQPWQQNSTSWRKPWQQCLPIRLQEPRKFLSGIDETLPTDALLTTLIPAHSCKLTCPVHCLKQECSWIPALVKVPEVTLKATKIRIQNIKELMQVCSTCTSRSIC